ncbi:MAG: hypothetical protein RI967_1653 [Planctomycetota bacterium]|jgi:hypothetical protein
MPNEPSESWQDDHDPLDGTGEASWEDDDGFEDDEDDSREGRSRARDTAFCPECGAEIYDAADICPACFSWIDGDTTRRPPRNGWFRKGGAQLVVWLLIAALLAGTGLFWLFRVLGAVVGAP